MKVLINGGCGFIGPHLTKRLSPFCDVSVIDSLMVNNWHSGTHTNPVHRKFLKQRLQLLDDMGIDVRITDLRDYDLLSRMAAEIRPDVMIHLAAVAHVSVAQKTPLTTFDHSLRTLENALDVSRETGVKKFVYFSSSTAYGDWTKEAMTEDEPLKPVGIYGSLKAAGELMVKAYGHLGLPYVIIRPSALYGPRCVSGRVLQKFIEQGLAAEPLKASAEALDFTHVDDLVEGVALAMGAENETFNLTYGKAVAVSDAAKIVGDHFKVPVEIANEAPLMMRGTLDITKARDMLGYDPKIPLEEGLIRYARWYQRNA